MCVFLSPGDRSDDQAGVFFVLKMKLFSLFFLFIRKTIPTLLSETTHNTMSYDTPQAAFADHIDTILDESGPYNHYDDIVSVALWVSDHYDVDFHRTLESLEDKTGLTDPNGDDGGCGHDQTEYHNQ